MAELDITSISVSQMQKLTVKFTTSTSFPVGGKYKLSWTDGTTTVESDFTHTDENATLTRGKTETQMKLNTAYDVTVQMLDASDAVVGTGAVFPFTASLVRDNIKTIHQAVYDVVSLEPLTDSYGRTVNILHKDYVPDDVQDGQVLAANTPWVSICRPETTESTGIGTKIIQLNHDLDIIIADQPNIKAVNSVSHLFDIGHKIIYRLMEKEWLDLKQCGISPKAIEYDFERLDDDGRNKLNVVVLTISVTQNKSI